MIFKKVSLIKHDSVYCTTFLRKKYENDKSFVVSHLCNIYIMRKQIDHVINKICIYPKILAENASDSYFLN